MEIEIKAKIDYDYEKQEFFLAGFETSVYTPRGISHDTTKGTARSKDRQSSRLPDAQEG